MHDPIRLAHQVKTIALIGASAKPDRPSYGVLKFLLAKGYNVMPVNPALAGGEIQGQRVAASLADLTGPIDMVDIFRNTDGAAEVIREAIICKDKLSLKIIWCQLGVTPEAALAEARDAGLITIMDKCPAIEWR